MKPFAFLFFTFIFLSSCSNNKTSSVHDADPIDKDEISRLREHFIPVLNGVWVLTDYIHEIEKTKSPLKASDKLQGIVTLVIDAGVTSDSLEVGASLNNHEGYGFTLFFATGQNENRLKTNIPDYDEASNFYELGYETINNTTFLFLYHYDKTNKLLDKRSFTKVADKQQDDDVAWGLQHFVNDRLFAGRYLLIDSTHTATAVTFKNDGSLIGSSDLKTYAVNTDFMGGPETVLDGMAFNMEVKDSKWFAFKIDRDTTYLYNTIGDEASGALLQLGKIQYRLVRQ